MSLRQSLDSIRSKNAWTWWTDRLEGVVAGCAECEPLRARAVPQHVVICLPSAPNSSLHRSPMRYQLACLVLVFASLAATQDRENATLDADGRFQAALKRADKSAVAAFLDE